MNAKFKSGLTLFLCFFIGLCTGIGSMGWHLSQEQKHVAELEEVVRQKEEVLRRKQEEVESARQVAQFQHELTLKALRSQSEFVDRLHKK